MEISWQLSAPDVGILNVFTVGGQMFQILETIVLYTDLKEDSIQHGVVIKMSG